MASLAGILVTQWFMFSIPAVDQLTSRNEAVYDKSGMIIILDLGQHFAIDN